MLAINFLPWRETDELKQKKALHRAFTFSFCLPIVLIMGQFFWLEQAKEHVLSQINQLSMEVSSPKDLSDDEMSEQFKQQQKVQAFLRQFMQPQAQMTFCLTEMVNEAAWFNLSGYTHSLAALLRFVQQLKKHQGFSDPQIKQIKKLTNAWYFVLMIKQD